MSTFSDMAVCTNLTQVPTVTNTYTNGFLSTVSGNALGVVTPGASTIDYHANGLVSSVGMNNNVAWQQGIASHWMARPTSITTTGTTTNLALTGYAYDGMGSITTDGVDAFRYDKVSRLVSGTANGATQTATYDSFGNLKTLGAATLAPVATTNRLPSTLASYAANGAVTAYGGDLFDLDPFGMIQAAHDATYSAKYWVFIYTADDERIWKYDMGPANTSWWKIRDLGGKVLSEYVNVGANWTAVSSYIYRDGTLLGRYAPGTSYPRRWFAVDHLGTPRRTFGENGTLIEAANYFPFGGIATAPGPAEETLRFTSHERDAAIAGGIDYMHARFYAPGVGRFLSLDPTIESAKSRFPQTWNRYAYVRNNPLTRTDPDGMRDIIRVPVNIIYSEADYIALPGRGYTSLRQTTEAGLREARSTYGRMGVVLQVRRFEAGSLINSSDSTKRNGSVFTTKGAVSFSTFLEATQGKELNVVAAGRLNRGGGSEGVKGNIWLGANQGVSTLTHELGHSLGNAFQQKDGVRYLYTELLWSLQMAIGFTDGFEQMIRATAEEYGCGADSCGGAWDPERK